MKNSNNHWLNFGFSISIILIMILIFVFLKNTHNFKEGFAQTDIDEIPGNISLLSKSVEETEEINMDDKKELLKLINSDKYSILSNYNLLVIEIKNNNGVINKSFLNNFNETLHGRFEKKVDSIMIDPKYKSRIKMFIERIDGNLRLLTNGCNEWSEECK